MFSTDSYIMDKMRIASSCLRKGSEIDEVTVKLELPNDSVKSSNNLFYDDFDVCSASCKFSAV